VEPQHNLLSRPPVPPEIINHAVWLYHRSCLTFRDVEDLPAERGIIVSYETNPTLMRLHELARVRSCRRQTDGAGASGASSNIYS
jgi:putative transposase